MKSLTETQCDELIAAIMCGDVDYCALVVLGRYICERKDDRLPRHVQCASESQAQHVLVALGHLPGCPSC